MPFAVVVSLLISHFALSAGATTDAPDHRKFIRVAHDGKSFQLDGSRFTPWGFNYDHDRQNRLLEYYWTK